ncbi:acetyl/propionyl/methylcrotonyl-CoA carboxylase subunit alpha [Luteimonas sp. FXH3W]|uniref:Acetyl/propionyl/methylcrotonyl-CoA carboxylase subunit alpha n=1 Tax=Aquilutibacter rugosus TaxID=3115820 RepID=A0ABU7V0E5_9GAMM
MLTKILIANRGEIACRIIRTAKRLGIRTVAVYSTADAMAQHVLQADEAYPIGGDAPSESYLRGDVILDVALRSGAQAIHPGYGFLSENADFAEAVQQAGLTFIGPRAESMRKMGSKAGAKDLMQAAGVPVVPGYTGPNQDPEFLQTQADAIGYPLMIKAAHGGGGKGMRIVRAAAEFAAALESCRREALNAFGRDRVLLERFIESPRHIEMQIFGDTHGNVVHLFERECSAQRRYQKVLEESPSPFLTPALRQAMGEAAVMAGQAIDYVNAGTVEFIVGTDGGFYFMEINTRLQVEHPVTEMVLGQDLVEWQLRVAAGEPLPPIPAKQTGHAIEVRLYAEDPSANFLPSSGTLNVLRLPSPSRHVRIDSGVVQGDRVTIYYDPMIAKLIVWDTDRPAALQRLREALAQCEIVGPKSNIEFLERLVGHPSVVNATIDTSYLDRHLTEVLPAAASAPTAVRTAAALWSAFATNTAAASANSPWDAGDGWRTAAPSVRIGLFQDPHDAAPMTLQVTGTRTAAAVALDGRSVAVSNVRVDADSISWVEDDRRHQYRILASSPQLVLHDGETRFALQPLSRWQSDTDAAGSAGDRITAPMPGRVVVCSVHEGDTVLAGTEVMVIEAMKMELSLKAPRDGVIASIHAQAGQFVEADTVLVSLQTGDAA